MSDSYWCRGSNHILCIDRIENVAAYGHCALQAKAGRRGGFGCLPNESGGVTHEKYKSTLKIYTWLSPSGFWEQIVALIIIPIIYIILFAAYLEIIQMVEG